MKIRPYDPTRDADDVRSLYERTERSFPMPDIEAPLFVRKYIVKNDVRVLGLGLIKITGEAILLLDSNLFKIVRAKVVQELIQTAVIECQKLGIDELHAFLTGDQADALATVLREKHGFERCVGIPMVLRI